VAAADDEAPHATAEEDEADEVEVDGELEELTTAVEIKFNILDAGLFGDDE